MVKRFNITSVIRDKEYDITKGSPGSKILYMTSNPLGETEVVYGVTESADARAAITATLGQAVLTIEEATLETQVTTSIETDADIYATTEQGNITFTIS